MRFKLALVTAGACLARSNIILVLAPATLACCAAENTEFQQKADAAYTQCVRAAARNLAVRSNEPADQVAAAAAKSCPGELKAVENSRVLPLGGAYEAAGYAQNVVQDMAKQLEPEVVQARGR
jgi:hypothetical protein